MVPGRRRNRNRRGAALIGALALALIMVMLGSALLSLAVTSLNHAKRRSYNAQALQASMGALDAAIREMKIDSTWGGYSSRTLGPATLAVVVAMPAGQPMRRTVTATSTVDAGRYSVTKVTRATLDLDTLPEVFYRAIAAKTSFGINGNVDISSTPAANRGDVHCNQNITFSGSAVDIYGAATASGQIIMSGSPNITRGATSGVPPMTFPTVTQEFKNESLVNGTYFGNKSISNGGVLEGKVVGNLTISGSGATLNGVVWVTGNVTISAGLYGDGTIICDGVLSLDARGNYAPTDASRIAVVTTSTSNSAVDLGGNRQFKGIIYAPNGGVRLHGTPSLLGSIIADRITFSGTPNITRLTDYDSNPPRVPKEAAVKGWEEL